jgi:hypothetical protein
MPRALSSRARKVFGALHIATSGVLAFGVFAGLPVRYAPVDTTAGLLAAALFVSGFGLLTGASWRERAARLVSWMTLGIGLALTAVLVLTASHVAGLYGPIGRGGALILSMVALLVLPYLVAVPALSVHWLSRRPR